MRVSRKSRNRFIAAGMLLAPLLCVQVARLVFDTGPSSAAAADVPKPAVPSGAESLPATLTPITARQRAALDWIEANASKRPESPLAYGLPAAAPQPAPVDQPTPSLGPAPTDRDPILDLRLTSVMGQGSSAVATINGRIVRVGGEVIAGWTLESVDARRFAVILRSDQGVERELIMPGRGPR